MKFILMSELKNLRPCNLNMALILNIFLKKVSVFGSNLTRKSAFKDTVFITKILEPNIKKILLQSQDTLALLTSLNPSKKVGSGDLISRHDVGVQVDQQWGETNTSENLSAAFENETQSLAENVPESTQDSHELRCHQKSVTGKSFHFFCSFSTSTEYFVPKVIEKFKLLTKLINILPINEKFTFLSRLFFAH